MKIRLLLALALAFSGIQAAQATPRSELVMEPYICNAGDVPEAAGATWIHFPNRSVAHTLQLTLSEVTPGKSSYVDFTGVYIPNFRGSLQSISFAVGPHTEKKDPTMGVINDQRIGPHIVGTYHISGGGPATYLYDFGANKKLATVTTADAQGFRTVTVTADDMASVTSPNSPLPIGAIVDVLTITVSGAVNPHIPLTEDIDSVVVNGTDVLVDLRPGHLFECPVLPPQGSGH